MNRDQPDAMLIGLRPGKWLSEPVAQLRRNLFIMPGMSIASPFFIFVLFPSFITPSAEP